MAGMTRQQRYANTHGVSYEQAGREIYAARKASGTARGLTTSQARGHGYTPEHGGKLIAPGKQSFAGREITSAYSDRVIERTINHAADDGQRVAIKVHTPDGGWVQLGGARGYSASMVANEVGYAGGLRGAIQGLPGTASGDAYDIGDIDAGDIDAWQIDVLEP